MNGQRAYEIFQKKKKTLYKKCLRKPLSHLDLFRYRHYRNLYNRLKTSAKRDYYHNKLDLHKSNIRQTWQVYRELMGKLNDKTSIPDMFIIDGRQVSDRAAIADGFTSYFTNIGKSLASKIPSGSLQKVSFYIVASRALSCVVQVGRRRSCRASLSCLGGLSLARCPVSDCTSPIRGPLYPGLSSV